MPECKGITVLGAPCQNPVVSADGYCSAHRPGGDDAWREQSRRGGKALSRRMQGQAFTADELTKLVTLEDAKVALDQVRVGVLTRTITHNEGSAAARAISEWVKAEQAAATARIVGELQAELERKASEIDALRKELAASGTRPFKVSSR